MNANDIYVQNGGGVYVQYGAQDPFGINNTIRYSVILAGEKRDITYHRDLPKSPRRYNSFRDFSRAISRYAGHVNRMYERLILISAEILEEEPRQDLRGCRVLLEAFLNGMFDLLAFLGKVRAMPFRVNSVPARGDSRRFRRKLIKILNRM